MSRTYDPLSPEAQAGHAAELHVCTLLLNTGALECRVRPGEDPLDNLVNGDLVAWPVGEPGLSFRIEVKTPDQAGGRVCLGERFLTRSTADVVALVSHNRSRVLFVERWRLSREVDGWPWEEPDDRAERYKLTRVAGAPSRMDVPDLLEWARTRKNGGEG